MPEDFDREKFDAIRSSPELPLLIKGGANVLEVSHDFVATFYCLVGELETVIHALLGRFRVVQNLFPGGFLDHRLRGEEKGHPYINLI